MRLIGEWRHLDDDAFKAHSPALSDVIRSLAGRARQLYELATGHVPDDERTTARNPQGRVGVDLSGPPWGSAMRHPIAWMGDRDEGSTGVQQVAPVITLAAGASTTIGPWRVWNRPHARPQGGSAVAPYSRGFLNVEAKRTSGSSTSDMIVTAWEEGDQGRARSEPFTLADSSSIQSVDVGASGAWIPLSSGWTTIFMRIENNSPNSVAICSIVINQIAKRSH